VFSHGGFAPVAGAKLTGQLQEDAHVRKVNAVALALVVIGALNWGLVGVFKVNLVETVFGESIAARAIYILVGVAGLYSLTFFLRLLKERP
jgi:uncharacterized membrane protein YuzA (DUF378 family)